MNKVFHTLIAFLFVSVSWSQTAGKIKGSLTSSDGSALAGANVSLEGTSIGSATSEDGSYSIINVPVGSYTVKFQYIGFKTRLIENVNVSLDLTTVLNEQLEQSSIEGEEVRVVAEKPLVKRDATNTKRVVSTEVIESLPLRSVDNIVGLQAGVVDNHVRGGRSGDNAYYVDGVLMKDHWSGSNATGGLSQAGMEQISLEAGGFGAEYGGANGGIINVTSKSGSQKVSGSVESVFDIGDSEAGTDPNGLYSYGYNVNNFEVGGPLGGNLRYWFMAEQQKTADKNPSYGSHPFANVTRYQTLEELNADNSVWETLPVQDTSGVWSEGTLSDNVFYYDEVSRTTSEIDTAGNAVLENTYLVGQDYSRKWGPMRNNGNERVRLAGNLGIEMGSMRFKLGYSGYNYSGVNNWNNNQLLNWDNATNTESSMNMFYLNGTISLSDKSYVNTVFSLKNYETTDYNGGISSNYAVVDKPWVDYGMRDEAWGSSTYYHRADGKQALSSQNVVYFTGHGYQSGSYSHRNESQTGLRLDYVNSIGKHEIKAGLESYTTKLRVYQISQGYEIYEQISKLDSDNSGSVSAEEVGDYNSDGSAGTASDLLDWEFSAYRNAYTTNIGYDIFGNESEDYSQNSHASAPGNPVSNRFYLQDQIEYSDVVIKAGLSFESWDPNTMGPDSDGDGKADDAGLSVINTVNNRIDRTGWKEVEAHTAILPRFGFAFPISDKTNFRAQYGSYWQEPTLSYVYLSDSRLAANVSQGNMVTTPNPAMKPEKTTSYEVGFTQQIGQSSALDIVGFYKEVRDYMQLVNRTIMLNGSEFSLAYYGTGDFGVTRGLSFNLSMRRVKGFLADFNYTWMEARGTGSDPASNFNIAWIGDEYPTVINRLDFDQTHTGSIIIDYRTQAKGLFSGLGGSAVYSFGSGQAYTPSAMVSTIFDRGWNRPLAAINSGSMPWYNNLDLRVDKKFAIGGYSVNVYALMLNALHQENVTSVQPTSGRADTDGWLSTAEGQIWLQSQSTLYPNADAEALYLDRVRNPSNWTAPRTLRIGLEANF